MIFQKKGERIDMHLKLPEYHAQILDRICREFELSRAQVVADLLDDYLKREEEKGKK